MHNRMKIVTALAVSFGVLSVSYAQPMYRPGPRNGPGFHGGPGPQHGPGFRPGPGRAPGPEVAYPEYRRFNRGDRLPPQYRTRQYVVNDWRGHHLQPPPRGYQWVQNGSDYVLAAIATGVISAIVLNALSQ